MFVLTLSHARTLAMLSRILGGHTDHSVHIITLINCSNRTRRQEQTEDILLSISSARG